MNQQAEKFRHLAEQATLKASRKDWPGAIACYEEMRALRPADADPLIQLSYVHSLSGNYRVARGYALKASSLAPTDPQSTRELIARLRTFNEAEVLNQSIDRLPKLDRVPIPQLISFAAQLSNFNEQERALQFLDEARRGDPDYPPTLIARGQVLTYLGRFDEAESDLRRSLARAPEIAQTYWLLSRLRTQKTGSNHVDAIRKQLARSGRRPEDIALLAFALHKELDDLGEHAGAWQALEQACRAKRSLLDYRIEDSIQLVSELVESPGSSHDQTRISALQRPVPIFIVGMHRSGTTLLEQLLHGHSGVRGLGELYDFTSQMRYATDYHCRGVIDRQLVERARLMSDDDFAAAGQRYLQGVAWRLGSERSFTDKLPSNFLNAGFICRALPQAKILHMRRDPMEVGFSNLRELFSDANPYSYDQREFASFYGQYERLMAHWHAMYPCRILDVDYAALVGQPDATMRTVADFCGLTFEPAMLDIDKRTRAVSTASAVAVRQGVTVRDVPKWLPYAEKLQPLAAALAEAGVTRA